MFNTYSTTNPLPYHCSEPLSKETNGEVINQASSHLQTTALLDLIAFGIILLSLGLFYWILNSDFNLPTVF